MGTELVNTEAFKGGPSQAFAALRPEQDQTAEGIGSSYAVIGYKGKAWSLRYKGEKKTFTRPDDGTPSSFIDLVILDAAPVKSKSYFEAFSEGDTSPPLCASMNGVTPDLGVPHKQSEHCASCPRNAWYTDPNGRKKRDCQDYKRLAVLLLPNQTQRMLGEPLLEPVFLRVPPASLNALVLMIDHMKAQGYHSSTYVTRVSFEPNEAFPKMVFKAMQPLTEKEAPIILTLRADTLTQRIIGGEVRALPAPAPVTAAVTQTAPVAPSPARAAAPLTIDVTPNLTPAAPTAAPTVVQPMPKTAEETTGIGDTGDLGFGMVGVAGANPTTTQTAPQPPTQTVADVGEPTEADAAMDARIAALMPTSAA